MASTEQEHLLDARHLPGCLRLSAAAAWNQNESDWRLMLGVGRGFGITLADGTLVACALALPYGADFGWISMVLVLPEHRRQGYATRVLRRAIAELEREGRAPVLDATPAGKEVYRQQGFRDAWSFRRFSRNNPRGGDQGGVQGTRALRAGDWPEVLGMDRRAFGASREAVLRSLAGRLPAAALVAERDGRLGGFLLGRDGRESLQLGPLVADDAGIAEALLLRGLQGVRGPAYLDVADHASTLHRVLEGAGFDVQRPFTRMVRGRAAAPGETTRVFLVAGPELG